jgi:RNA polymerase sigma-70 factor, ECF subfamily
MENGQPLQTDRELVSRARHGDPSAFHLLVDRYGGALFALAVRLVGNAADAQDVMQEVLTGAFRGIHSFRHESSLKTWLTQILVRQAARHRREQGRYRLHVQNQSQAVRTPGQDRADIRMDLAEALAALSDEHREVIVLRELEGLGYEEIAAVLKLPRGTVESRLFRARRELQSLLEEYRP